MPDWSYCTLGKPLVFRFRPYVARKWIVYFLGQLARLPGGVWVIDWLGHMRGSPLPADSLSLESDGNGNQSLVGLGACIDPDLDSVAAFERFGIGFMVIGPFGTPLEPSASLERNDAVGQIKVPVFESNLTVEDALCALSQKRLRDVRTLLWIEQESQLTQLEVLGKAVDGVIVPSGITALPEDLACPVFVRITPETPPEDLVPIEAEHRGFYVVQAAVDRMRVKGAGCAAGLLCLMERLKDLYPDRLVIVDGGVMEPGDAIDLLRQGADRIVVDAGMVFNGPGLVKRINETIAAEKDESPKRCTNQTSSELRPATRSTWFWVLLMGTSMVIGGVIATLISLTRVVLPYDEATVGMSRLELLLVNDRLLDFMKHDRLTLAGTMFSVGGLYMALAWFGIRRGQHWASITVFISAFIGFASFFLFLGFGYFDAFHAFVTAILFQFLLLAVFSHDVQPGRRCYPDLRNDPAWKRFLWGQLMFIAQGAALIVAGLVICKIGITTVFVPEDMAFMCTTPEKLLSANPQLIPLVAHDRATFGGMLVSCGVVVLLTSLWGLQRGVAWVWWALLMCGAIAYLMTIGIHHYVGYVDIKHLAPAYGGFIALLVACGLTRGYLCDGQGVANK